MKNNLPEIDQGLINAIFRHNGREVPRPVETNAVSRVSTDLIGTVRRLKSLLDLLDPDMGYEDWVHVGMALYFETGGDEVGRQLFDEWSSKGEKYPGSEEIRYKYESFSNHTGPSITIATLIKMVRDQGHEWIDPGIEQFERCETVIINPEEDSSPAAPLPLDKFSLRGQLSRLEELSKEQVQLLYGIALSGQATVFYASPNTGKTLLALHLLLDAIRRGVIDPAKVYYINVDDSLLGLLTKLELAEEHGFHMLSEGYQDFSAAEFLLTLHEMTIGEQANGVVIILDTLKKFTDLMDKRKASEFSKYIRRFVLQGGTVIALAHTNKNPGPDGRPRYSGTTDIVDDFDCAYTLAEVSTSEEAQEKVVEFVNFKRRGNVVRQAAYSYSIEDGLSYDDLLLSVKKVDDTQLVAVKKTEALKSDAEVIAAVIACIREGVNTKMRLADATAERAGTSRRNALKVIEKYTGSDPANHQWRYTVSERGAKVYSLLEEQSDD